MLLNAGKVRKQAFMRLMGLPWYGGRLPKPDKADRIVSEASKVAHGALEVLSELGQADLPGVSPVEREAEHMGESLLYGMGKGLTVIADVCDEYLRLRQYQTLEEMNPKIARMAIDASMGVTRLGARVMEEAFRRRRNDTVGKLLEQLRPGATIEGTAENTSVSAAKQEK